MTATNREVDGYTHLALSVMYALYDKGWGRDYPHEIAEIMQKILDLDRKAYKPGREGRGMTREAMEAMGVKTLEQEPCEDCISRTEAIKALEYNLSVETDGGFDKYRTVIKDLLNAIYNTQKKAIEDLSSVQPKQKTNVLDKIKAEITEDIEKYSDIYDEECAGLRMALDTIDKYIEG